MISRDIYSSILDKYLKKILAIKRRFKFLNNFDVVVSYKFSLIKNSFIF